MSFAVLGDLNWLAAIVAGVFEPTKPQPMTWFGITAGYHLVGVLIASVVVSA